MVGHFDIKAYYHCWLAVWNFGIAMDLDRSFGFLLHDVARLFARRFNQRALLFLGLTRAQCKVLGYLARNEGINQAGLADLLEIKPMTLVRQIDRIEEDGWIERRPDPGDRRARRLVLTEKARPILSRILDLSTEVRNEAFAGLSEAEGRHLIRLLGRVHGNLSERVPPLAVDEFSDLDESHDHTERRVAAASADLSSVGGQR
jgi:MarR family transcriptional regulator, transcriptional regulator for hemolysin